MKKILFTVFTLLAAVLSYGQTTYYWVGGVAPTTSLSIGTNWNTSLDGSGSSRPSSTGPDILVVDGTNLGGSTPATGTLAMLINSSITAAQLKFVNGATVTWVRAASGTSTITISGEDGDDFVIEAGCSLSFLSTVGSIRVAMGATNTGRVSGALNFNTNFQARFDNTTAGTPRSFVFTPGSSMSTNITSTSSSYAFGSNTQSSEKWVWFQDGSNLYYNGGFSPMGSVSTYSAIDFDVNSTWHHRADNPATGAGSFFNRKSFGNIVVENNAILAADGPIYRLNNLTINAGSSMITHNSGETVLLGNLIANGPVSAPAAGTNEMLMAGGNLQTISGTAAIAVSAFTIASGADVVLAKSINVEQATNVFGKLSFGINQITGTGSFTAVTAKTAVTGTANSSTGSYLLTGNNGIANMLSGYAISGTGIASGTTIAAFSPTNDTIFLSKPAMATAIGVAINVSTTASVLQTAHVNGFNPATGSVASTGNQVFEDQISYIIDGATASPFGISTGTAGNRISLYSVEVNAPVVANAAFTISNALLLNGKLSLRPADTLHLLNTATLGGSIGATNYIATTATAATGPQSYLQWDGRSTPTLFPVGSDAHYLPLTLTPTGSNDFIVSVFEGITANGAIDGTAFSALQKQTVVDAVWQVNRSAGSGDVNVNIGWDAVLEGSTFLTLPNSDIGLISNTGTLWSAPLGTGDNSGNTAGATTSVPASFSAGAVAQVDPFVFNPLPEKVYGDADFTGGATSLNTTQPIVYSSSNTAVASIVAGAIHITGTGNTDITASQASDGFYPAASVTRNLVVQKAALTITADHKTKFEAEPNPTLTVTYTGFVLGETASVFLTPAVVSTTATTASAPGTYPITVTAATAANYQISFVNGTLTVQPKQTQTITFNALPTKAYGSADFSVVAASTNNTLPLGYSSSNTNVATINAGLIHITGAGTTDIMVSQAGSTGFFPATSVVRSLTVTKIPLTIKVADTSRVVGTANPPFTITYTGFVLGETAANLTTPPVATTDAGINASPGNYTISLAGAVSQNYNFTYVNGRLSVLPPGGTSEPYLSAFVNGAGKLTVRVFSPKAVLGDIIVYDMMGRPVATRNLFMPTGFISADLFVSTVPPGLYAVCIRGNGLKLQTLIYLNK